jgi:polyisoprenoid-binding protein YceI
MKTYLRLLPVVIIFLLLGVANSCDKEDDVTPTVVPITRGTDALSCTDCTPQNYLNALMNATTTTEIGDAHALIPSGQWYVDKPHSSVYFEAPWQEIGADITGKFKKFAINSFVFDEANPANISFDGTVWLNSCITGEYLRDEGCLPTYLGTNLSYIDETENRATIKTTSVKYNTDDAGYTVDANLTFFGVTSPVALNLIYLGQTKLNSYTAASFQFSFMFNAVSEFGITGPIGDPVTIILNLNLRYYE